MLAEDAQWFQVQIRGAYWHLEASTDNCDLFVSRLTEAGALNVRRGEMRKKNRKGEREKGICLPGLRWGCCIQVKKIQYRYSYQPDSFGTAIRCRFGLKQYWLRIELVSFRASGHASNDQEHEAQKIALNA